MSQDNLARAEDGTFPEGVSGNPKGRPRGSKNKITVLKLSIEEAFREKNEDRISKVLDMVVSEALTGNMACMKMIWDACVSKSQIAEDKAAGQKQTITVHRMNVVKSNSTGEKEDA